MLWTGRGVDVARNVLIAFDLLLVVVLGLLLYCVSARDPRLPPGVLDFVQLVLVVSALLADAVALWAIATRISEFGATPNRFAALGENVILLITWRGRRCSISASSGEMDRSRTSNGGRRTTSPSMRCGRRSSRSSFRRCSGTSDGIARPPPRPTLRRPLTRPRQPVDRVHMTPPLIRVVALTSPSHSSVACIRAIRRSIPRGRCPIACTRRRARRHGGCSRR